MVETAGSSSRLLAGVRIGMATNEESRQSLQQRLVVLSRLLFWSFIVLIVGMVLLYRAFPGIEPHHQNLIYQGSLGGLVLLGAIWRGILLRREVALAQLYAIDVFYSAVIGCAFAGSSIIAWDFRVSATANILWASFSIFLRAIVVPSTGSRTLFTGIAMFIPLVLAAVWVAVYHPWPDLPGPALVGATIMIGGVVVLLATIGSRLIYGLRRQISAAMRLGQYTLGAKIGEGGNGAVYRAHHALLRRPTAIKLIRPERVDAQTLDRFEREVQLMSQLTHANTVAVFDYGHNADGVFYYAMEYLDGIDLEKLVTKFGPQPSDRVAAILVQVCGALQEAHRRGIVHRDVKPGNIILCERGDVADVAKVVDFGLVKEITRTDGGEARVMGTPAYIAPEVVTDPKSIGPAADLYALGAVAYYLVTGRRVFEGNPLEVCVKHVTTPPDPPSSFARVPAELERIIMRCLAKNPTDRPESAAALARMLRALPANHDWSEDDAQLWWRDFRALEQPTTATPTLTITIDLATRELAA
jgi:serine/threonine-protein kinase